MQNLVNISIDDVSPHPRSSIKVVDRCFELINIFPNIKFSLFVPVAYWRTMRKEVSTPTPLCIEEYPYFCKFIENLPKKNFEICFHGVYHGIPGKSDNDEFQSLSYEEALKKFTDMKKIVKSSGLEKTFKPIFRPPAWRMSPGSIRAARAAGIRVLALSEKEYAKKTYAGEDEKFRSVLYYSCNPPFDPLFLSQKTEIVYHACEWDKNYLSKILTKNLIDFLKLNEDEVKFSFIEGMTNESKENSKN